MNIKWIIFLVIGLLLAFSQAGVPMGKKKAARREITQTPRNCPSGMRSDRGGPCRKIAS